MIGFFFFTTQYLQEVLGFDPLQAGIGFLPMTAVNFAVAMSIPRLAVRMPGSVPLVAGILLTLAGMFWLSRVGVDSAYLTGVALPMILIGAGQGLAFAPLTSFGIIGAPASDAGAASGLVNTFHQVGTCLGLGIAVAAAATVPTTGSAVAHLAAAGQRRSDDRQRPAAPCPGRHRGPHSSRRPGRPPHQDMPRPASGPGRARPLISRPRTSWGY